MKGLTVLIAACLIIMVPASVWAHCQVPCGIYNDVMRVMMLEENITTIEKSMNQINELGNAVEKNYNQIVRWVNNKDDHADQFMDIIYNYFLAQRIKLTESTDMAYPKYQHQLELLHQLTVYAMKCKQTTDLANVETLKKLVDDFAKSYLTPDDYKHFHEH